MGLPFQSFSIIQGMDTRPAVYKNTPLLRFEINRIPNSQFPIQTHLVAFLGFLRKTKIKAYTKLTVVRCCHIIARTSVAPSVGNFWRQPAPRYVCGQDQEFRRKAVLVK